MSRLPIIVGFGGINAAGRSSFHHGYRRLVVDALSEAQAARTWHSLAQVMNLETGNGLDAGLISQIRDNTLIRRIGSDHFDTENIPWNRRVNLRPEPERPIFFDLRTKHLPAQIPDSWEISHMDDRTVRVIVQGACEMMLPDSLISDVKAAGQLPTGFDPKVLYQSRNHPRGIQMTVYGASDALQSVGIDWEQVRKKVSPDEISVYAGSAMSQLDHAGNGGMMASRALGKRVTSKQCALGFAEMPADFINAYVLGSVGMTGTSMGACASFLYNLRLAVNDIRSGKSRVVIVGNSEAPITPEIIEGYSAMGALATAKELCGLEGKSEFEEPDFQRSCRPFSANCGFTIAESAQFLVLFDDELALELGANMHGAIDDVFVNADGHKKSISAPGIGNYITVAKALASAQQIVGEKAIRENSFVQAHGTGTPQNRVTESHVLNECAKAFGIESWPLAAVKCFLGHSIGVAGGDQIMATLGVWAHGILPGIRTIDHVADDVHNSNLAISSQHSEFGENELDVAIINAKGFGGNNASASMLAPHVVNAMLEKKHGKKKIAQWRSVNETVATAAAAYDQLALAGEAEPIYKFNHNVLSGENIRFADGQLNIEGYDPIELFGECAYGDML
ncbi:MAG: beta-ketoacyl synthase [Pseudomonadales bacterium]